MYHLLSSSTLFPYTTLFRSCNSLTQSSELLRSTEPEDPLDDPTLAVEQHRIGQPPIVIELLHAPAPHQDRERRPVLSHERQHGRRIQVVRHARDLEGLAGKLAVQLGHVG